MVDDKGFPLKVINDINIYKYEKLGINLRKIIIRDKIPKISLTFTKPNNQETSLEIL